MGGASVLVVDGATGELIASRDDVGPSYNTKLVSAVVAADRLYVGSRFSGDSVHENPYEQNDGRIWVLDPNTLATQKQFACEALQLAYDPANSASLFLTKTPRVGTQISNDWLSGYEVGVLDQTTGVLGKITTGYLMADVYVNGKANRVYVPDYLSNRIFIYDATTHQLVGSAPMGFIYTRYPPTVRRYIAVSERLNQFFVLRDHTPRSGVSSFSLDACNGSTGALIWSVLVAEPSGQIVVVDDLRRRIYVQKSVPSDSSDANLMIFNEDTGTLVTTVWAPLPSAYEPFFSVYDRVRGRFYGNVLNHDGKLLMTVYDADTLKESSPIDLSAYQFPRPGRMFPTAVDETSGTVYVANQGETQNNTPLSEILAVDEATHAVRARLRNSADTYFSPYVAAVDETTHSVYVSHDYPTAGLYVFDGNTGALLDDLTRDFPGFVAAFDSRSRRLFVAQDGTIDIYQNSTPAQPQTLANISTRGIVAAGDSALIGGFIVSGTEATHVLVRAIGPSLRAAGLSNAVADTTLEVHTPAGAVFRNDDWKVTYPELGGDQSGAIAATGVAPKDARESAMILPASPGTYTAIVRSKGGADGLGLVEVFDLDHKPNSHLGNVSTRGYVGSGNNVLIGGVIVTGAATSNVVVRAIGPSLAHAGISNPLSDPTLELHDAYGELVASNDDWQTANSPGWENGAAEVSAANLAPSDPRESALPATLYPGNYTAIVRGKGYAQGVALVEVYHISSGP